MNQLDSEAAVSLPVFLLGAGGHGRVVLDTLSCNGINVSGIIDPGLAVGKFIAGVEVVGGDDYLYDLDPRGCILCLGVGAMPGRLERMRVFADVSRRGFTFINVVHPSAVVSRSHQFGQGVQILAGAVIQAGTCLGDNVIVNTSASVDHDCKIGRDVMIGPGATVCGSVCIGDGAYIGAGTVILPGVTVANRGIVGAGSVVVKHVGEGETVMGNPARRARRLRADDA